LVTGFGFVARWVGINALDAALAALPVLVLVLGCRLPVNAIDAALAALLVLVLGCLYKVDGGGVVDGDSMLGCVYKADEGGDCDGALLGCVIKADNGEVGANSFACG
jgi:hypothetical protein